MEPTPLNASCQFVLTRKQRIRQYKLYKKLKKFRRKQEAHECSYCGSRKLPQHGAKLEVMACERCKNKFTAIQECSACKCEGCVSCGLRLCPKCWKSVRSECAICRFCLVHEGYESCLYCRDCCITCEACERKVCSNHEEKNMYYKECEKCGEVLCNIPIQDGVKIDMALGNKSRGELHNLSDKNTCFSLHKCSLPGLSEFQKSHYRFINTHKTGAFMFSNNGSSAAGMGIAYTNLKIEWGKEYRWGTKINLLRKNATSDHIILSIVKNILPIVHEVEWLSPEISKKRSFLSYLFVGKEFHQYKIMNDESKNKWSCIDDWPDQSEYINDVKRGDVFEFVLNLEGETTHFFQVSRRGKTLKFDFPVKYSIEKGETYHVSYEFCCNCSGATDKITLLDPKEDLKRCWSCEKRDAQKKCSRCSLALSIAIQSVKK